MPRKRAQEPVTIPTQPKRQGKATKRKVHYEVNRHVLASLGWEGVEPLSGDEDELYRWITEPEQWAHLLMSDVDARVRRRLVQLHSSLLEEMHAHGFVLWRSLPALLPGLQITIRHSKSPQLPVRRFELPAVRFRRDRLTPSSHFDDNWVLRSHHGPPGNCKGWLRNACNLIQQVTFPFVGSSMPVVDGGWVEDRFTRSDAVLYALCEGGGRGHGVMIREVAGEATHRRQAGRPGAA